MMIFSFNTVAGWDVQSPLSFLVGSFTVDSPLYVAFYVILGTVSTHPIEIDHAERTNATKLDPIHLCFPNQHTTRSWRLSGSCPFLAGWWRIDWFWNLALNALFVVRLIVYYWGNILLDSNRSNFHIMQQQLHPHSIDSSMAPPCIHTMTSADLADNTTGTRTSPEKPIRNLTHAFEALCREDETNNMVIPQSPDKSTSTNISPTGVDQMPLLPEPALPIILPNVPFKLHPDLQREMSDYLVQRVSAYSLVHDINKEAGALSAQDPHMQEPTDSSAVTETTEALNEESPLVCAVQGRQPKGRDPSKSIPAVAIVDEEKWLLRTIYNRSAKETKSLSHLCPPTFLEAMGEKEYENPVNALAGHARTQLWKPSRSWWEAKSGKNAWIEPGSHNKRWR